MRKGVQPKRGSHGQRVFASERIERLPEYGSTREVAEVLGVSSRLLGYWIAKRGLTAVRDSRGVYRLKRTAITAWLISQGRYEAQSL